jgi:hypothetical protein
MQQNVTQIYQNHRYGGTDAPAVLYQCTLNVGGFAALLLLETEEWMVDLMVAE